MVIPKPNNDSPENTRLVWDCPGCNTLNRISTMDSNYKMRCISCGYILNESFVGSFNNSLFVEYFLDKHRDNLPDRLVLQLESEIKGDK